jgi:hypothetical protein
LVLHEDHLLCNIYNDVMNVNKERPSIITKKTLDSYTQDIDHDLAKLDADKKDYEKNK